MYILKNNENSFFNSFCAVTSYVFVYMSNLYSLAFLDALILVCVCVVQLLNEKVQRNKRTYSWNRVVSQSNMLLRNGIKFVFVFINNNNNF